MTVCLTDVKLAGRKLELAWSVGFIMPQTFQHFATSSLQKKALPSVTNS